MPRSLHEPHPSRLALDHPRRDEIIAAHDAALSAGALGYVDPVSGLFALTSQTLLDRGDCCAQGCRHCPFIE
ncbi:MAG: DUF5522 domain-containing protein [Ilumatobacteraceae bacterium]